MRSGAPAAPHDHTQPSPLSLSLLLEPLSVWGKTRAGQFSNVLHHCSLKMAGHCRAREDLTLGAASTVMFVGVMTKG